MRKFSTLIKRMVVELDRDPVAFPDGNIVEVGGAPQCLVECHLKC
jgi:SWI/SNF-related matrix-associated actin-dependent regulator of chromatin subfamily D